MATSTQDKFERKLAEEAELFDVSVVTDRRFSNVGVYRLQGVDDFVTRVRVDFDWQGGNGYATLKIGPPEAAGDHGRLEGGVKVVHLREDFSELGHLIPVLVAYAARKVGVPG